MPAQRHLALAQEDELEPGPGELERLGDSAEWGRALLRLLIVSGWRIDERPVLAWTEVVARKGDAIVTGMGDTLADAAYQVFTKAMDLKLWRAPVVAR